MKSTTFKNIARTIIAVAFVLFFLAITASVTAHSAPLSNKRVNINSLQKVKSDSVKKSAPDTVKPHTFNRTTGFSLYAWQSHLFTAEDGHDYLVFTDARKFASMLHSEGCKLCERSRKVK